MTMNRLAWAGLLACCLGGVAAAQDRDLRSGNLPPRTGLVSEEVARQKLAAFGLVDVKQLRQEGDRWRASATSRGQDIEVEVDSQTGHIRETGRAEPLQVPEGAGPGVMRDHALKIERDEIARVPMTVEPFAPDRPTAIRPLGDRPVSEPPRIAPPPGTRSPRP
jgi:hypothetical protein